METLRTLLLAACLTLLIAGVAGAQADPPNSFGTPDGLPPSIEEVCDEESGAAYGLCTAFCEAMDCDSSAPQASERACNRVGDRFVQLTGALPPCLQTCPCWDAADLNSVTADNQDLFSCIATDGGGLVIQNDGSTPGVEGGFVTIAFEGLQLCSTRDLPPFAVEITTDEFATCTATIAARCDEIGGPAVDNPDDPGDGGTPPPA